MKRLALTKFSLRFPWLVIVIVISMVVAFGSQFPKVKFDNDPENMLSKDEPVRLFHHKVKEKFALYDFVIVGIVNDNHPDGIFNVDTLSKIDVLTKQLLSLRQLDDGTPEALMGDGSGEYKKLDLQPKSSFSKGLNIAFSHNPNRLFSENGSSAIIGRELISPSVVDNIKQAEFGSLKLEYLMENIPKTREDALVIRDDSMSNPLYKGTLVSEDGKAICLYLPIAEKTFSHNVANLVEKLTEDWSSDDHVYITGLPVAEDTFGVEMLVQMATSAPLAGLAIFVLLLIFFKRITLIIAPMLVAVVSVVCTMGLLIGLGYDVHIMSSMIAIFLMPIAVADAVHILSEFFDVYHKYNNKKETLRHVVSHLFMPMLYTSLTTIAGFASLATTPIPPVRVFGLHVAFGVALAWVLTMTFVPAFITIFISEKSMDKLCAKTDKGAESHNGFLDRFLRGMGGMTYRRARIILVVAVMISGFSVWGLTHINVNDNPVKWFSKTHPVRVADKVLNSHFGGTYTAYLTFVADPNATMTCREMAETLRSNARLRFGKSMSDELSIFIAEVDTLEISLSKMQTCNPKQCFDKLSIASSHIDKELLSSWNLMADEVNYLEDKQLTISALSTFLKTVDGIKAKDVDLLLGELDASNSLDGEALRESALEVCDRYMLLSFERFVDEMRTEMSAPTFKQPKVLQYFQNLQMHLDGIKVVGKTTSALDALKKAGYELKYKAVPDGLTQEQVRLIDEQNIANFAIPESAAEAGQVYIQLEGMKKKDSIFHLVTRNYQEANIWVQLTSGDNQDMQAVVKDVEEYIAENEPPVAMEIGWAGLTYLNVVWQDKMVSGMFSSLISSFVVVLVMMMVLFRSPLYGFLAMVPLSLTITFIYGLIGWMGKDYDMPVAVLSSMTLGLSVDFAIHFLERAREEHKRYGSWAKACVPMFAEPAKAISRNAITISIGFTPLLLAPLMPYRTVGFFLATIMAASWMATLLVLPALLTVMRKFAFKDNNEESEE